MLRGLLLIFTFTPTGSIAQVVKFISCISGCHEQLPGGRQYLNSSGRRHEFRMVKPFSKLPAGMEPAILFAFRIGRSHHCRPGDASTVKGRRSRNTVCLSLQPGVIRADQDANNPGWPT